MLVSVGTKKKRFKNIIFKNYQRSVACKSTSQNFPSSKIMSEYMLHVYIKSNVATRNNKSRGKFRRFTEEYPKCGRFYQTI